MLGSHGTGNEAAAGEKRLRCVVIMLLCSGVNSCLFFEDRVSLCACGSEAVMGREPFVCVCFIVCICVTLCVGDGDE